MRSTSGGICVSEQLRMNRSTRAVGNAPLGTCRNGFDDSSLHAAYGSSGQSVRLESLA